MLTVNKPFLSPETCVKLGLLKLSFTGTAPVNSMVTEPVESSVPLTREKIKGLGHIGESGTFVINPNHSPVQHAPRWIPVTLQKEVKEKISELEKKGIIQRMTDSTDWFSNMVIASRTLSPVEQRYALMRKNVWPLCLVAKSSHSTSQDKRKSPSNQIISRAAVNIKKITSVCAKPSPKNKALTTEIQPSSSL